LFFALPDRNKNNNNQNLFLEKTLW